MTTIKKTSLTVVDNGTSVDQLGNIEHQTPDGDRVSKAAYRGTTKPSAVDKGLWGQLLEEFEAEKTAQSRVETQRVSELSESIFSDELEVDVHFVQEFIVYNEFGRAVVVRHDPKTGRKTKSLLLN